MYKLDDLISLERVSCLLQVYQKSIDVAVMKTGNLGFHWTMKACLSAYKALKIIRP